MLREWDNIHYNFRKIDGANKPYNLIVSAREAGKTSAAEVLKAWKVFKEKNWKTIFLRRQIADITDLYIESFQVTLNLFIDEDLKLEYKKLDKSSGSVKIFCKSPLTGKSELFIIIIGMSQPIQRIKSNAVIDLAYIFFDEYIINPKWKEKYLPYEMDKVKEVYTTFKRYLPLEWKNAGKYVKVYFLGNPYTVFSPFTEAFGVEYSKMIPGAFMFGDVWAVENYRLCPELVEQIKRENPFYQRDDEYTNYALKGIAINDQNIRLGKRTNGFVLKFVITVEGQQIGIYKNSNQDFNQQDRYYCGKEVPSNINREVFCFDFEDLSGNKILYNKKDNVSFELFKIAMRNNWVIFDDLGTYYKIRNAYVFM